MFSITSTKIKPRISISAIYTKPHQAIFVFVAIGLNNSFSHSLGVRQDFYLLTADMFIIPIRRRIRMNYSDRFSIRSADHDFA